MIDKKIQNALNEQINAEMASAYLYLSMSAWFDSINLKGMAHWMRIQSKEEMGHAMKIFGYINERSGRVELSTVQGPAQEWASPLAAFEAAYSHERGISSRFDRLMELAQSEKDHATVIFLQWFVTEQVEEEAAASEAVEKLKMAGDNKGALYILDREFGARA